MNARYTLPIIPKPKNGTADILKYTGEGIAIYGSGNIDLHCGACSNIIAKGMNEGQIKTITLQCNKCDSYNAVVNIPSFKDFITQLTTKQISDASIPKFKSLIKNAVESNQPYQEITSQIEEVVPEFSWFNEYLVPGNPGEIYGFLGFILAFITWYQTSFRVKKQQPTTIINNYFSSTDPYSKVGRNDLCPCNSGKKFKKCHG